MRIFSALYDKAMIWAKHPHAPRYLACLSFAESAVFPLPPDIMLVPMTLAKPENSKWYAGITTIASVLGGLVGYALGFFFIALIQPYLVKFGYAHTYQYVLNWFSTHGLWVMFVAAFSPIPYKLFTIAGGAMHMPLLPFVVACSLGRAARFYLVSGLISWGGERIERILKIYIDAIGWALVIVALLGYAIWYGLH